MKRAIDPQQKELRKASILDAAFSLFETNDGHLSSVADIARRAGVAKGTVYLYFKTREEIYLTLLDKFMEDWFVSMNDGLDHPQVTLDIILQAACRDIIAYPAFMQLAATFNAILDRNIDFQTAYIFKQNLRDRILETGKRIHRVFPIMSETLCVRLILRSFALSIGLWQIAEPAPILKEILTDEAMSSLRLDFSKELTVALHDLWTGALKSLESDQHGP